MTLDHFRHLARELNHGIQNLNQRMLRLCLFGKLWSVWPKRKHVARIGDTMPQTAHAVNSRDNVISGRGGFGAQNPLLTLYEKTDTLCLNYGNLTLLAHARTKIVPGLLAAANEEVGSCELSSFCSLRMWEREHASCGG